VSAGRLELLDLVTGLAGAARPGEQLEVFAARGHSTKARAHGGEVEAFTSAEAYGIGVRVVLDHRVGFASAGSLDPTVVAEVVAEARDNAGFAEVDEWAGVAEPDGVDAVEIDLWRPGFGAFPTEGKIALALDLERAVLEGDPRITGVRTSAYGDSASEAAVATSTGIARWSRATSCSLSVLALAADGEATQTGSGLSVGREPVDLDLVEAATDAVVRATSLLGAGKVSSRRVPLVLEPRMASTVLGLVAGTLTGGPVVKGRSPFAERMEEQVASPLLTLVDDPTDQRSLGADSHDGEGLATRRNVLVDAGVLRGYLLDSYTGRRLGLPSTGSAVRGSRSIPQAGVQALGVAPGEGDLDSLAAAHEGALVVRSMTGLHSGVNPVSGDFSVGVEGHLVRGGEAAEPVREVTVASTLQRLLLDITAVGADVEWLPSGNGVPSIVVGEVALSGS
jgi:PmbA protein